MKFRAHETFFIRKGWLSKGMKKITSNPNVFMGLDKGGNKINPMDELGIGANMVKSLRYWMQAVGLAEEKLETRKRQVLTEEKLETRKRQVFTELGELIYKNDPYVEETGTLCLLHYNLCINKKLATSWFFFFNVFSLRSFTKDDFVMALNGWYTLINGDTVSRRSLEDDFDCIMHTYISRERSGSTRFSPENNIDCPLGDLELIDPIGKKTRVSTYRKKSIGKNALHPFIALATIVKQANGKIEVPIGTLLNAEESIGRAFNLDTIALSSVLAELEALSRLKIIRTAGLDVVRITTDLTFMECVKEYYKSISRGANG
jgi:hypothetical protein